MHACLVLLSDLLAPLPSHLLAVSIMSFASARPTSRGSLCVPPIPGITLKVTSGCAGERAENAKGQQQMKHLKRSVDGALKTMYAVQRKLH